jgi:hypothetical protein
MEDCISGGHSGISNMKRHHAILFVLSIFSACTAQASDVSWMFQPGYYTHSPTTGQRVAQYEPEKPAYATIDPTYQESGYRHELIQAGNEWVNIVQTWGAGTAIRPYGEWEYPYRAGATPYGPWGNPQGPWTLPFDSWRNPYGLNHMQNHGAWQPGYGSGGPIDNGAWAPGPQPLPAAGGAFMPSAAGVPAAQSAVPAPPVAAGQGQAL